MRKPFGPGGAIFSVVFNHAADKVAVGGADGAIRIWNVANVPREGGNIKCRRDKPRTRTSAEVRSVTFSPDDQLVASGGADNLVRLWDSNKLNPVGQLPPPGAKGHTRR